MPAFESATVAWVVLGCLGMAIVSALVPWVNAELILLAAIPMVPTPGARAAVVVAMTLGQMIGKGTMYWMSRGACATPNRRPRALESWRATFEHRPRASLAVIGVSALIGIPPFYLVSVAAGAARVPFGVFLTVGGLGRLAHFACFASLPGLAQQWL